ncbi:hypothetical protein [Prochlorococcus sp. MIT 0916]|uniref:hypothetical protein n=1 Tax=Prochlorococcus sp. MIT 0916 TaxID=3082521 RepID=UPI0039B3ABC7
MKNFWPHRSKAKGFSIENLARNYRLKISNSRMSSNGIQDQLLDDKNLISMKEEGENISIANLSIKRIHWANRDFSEYKEAA